MPARNNTNRRNRRARTARRGGEATDREIAQSSQVVGRAFVLAPAVDYRRKQLSFALNQSPPLNFRELITWVRAKHSVSITISNSVPTENNVIFHLSDFSGISGIAAFFDQYAIYSATASITPSFEGAGSTLYTFGTCFTAIDYDNVNALGSADAIQSFNSCVTFEMSPGQSIQRFLKPCVAPAVYTTAGSGTFSGYGVARMWIDSAVTNVPHYGFRSYFIGNSVSGLSCTFDYDVVIGLRNNM
jgi:hypothetical protein